MRELDYAQFDAITFDCYGTLIDWETGILAGLRQVLAPREVVAARADEPTEDQLLGAYARFEARAEAGPYRRYREILADAARGLGAEYGIAVPDPDAAAFGESVGDWPAFPDSAAALARLHERFRLGVITNCDDDLFARSAARLGTDFDWIVTAESVGSYKPNPRNFDVALERIGLPRERILHVAQSLFHDHVPAKALGFTTVWIDRRHDRPGSGATPAADATPDATFPDMRSFADAAAAAGR